MEGYLFAQSIQEESLHLFHLSARLPITSWLAEAEGQSHPDLYYTSSTAICKQLWEFISGSNLKCECLVTCGSKVVQKKELQAKMRSVTDGLPVFRLVDGEYDSWRGGLLLDGGQEGKLTFTPEQLHHSLCDVCRGVNCSPHIWKNEVRIKNLILSVCKPFKMCCLLPVHLSKVHATC